MRAMVAAIQEAHPDVEVRLYPGLTVTNDQFRDRLVRVDITARVMETLLFEPFSEEPNTRRFIEDQIAVLRLLVADDTGLHIRAERLMEAFRAQRYNGQLVVASLMPPDPRTPHANALLERCERLLASNSVDPATLLRDIRTYLDQQRYPRACAARHPEARTLWDLLDNGDPR
jgi:hypothetical protein